MDTPFQSIRVVTPDDAPRSATRRASGFTLIEVLACLGIFAVGFAAIAMMLPAGFSMQRDIQGRGMGDILGRNSLEIVKAKGIHALTYAYTGADYSTRGLDWCGLWWWNNGGSDKDLDYFLAFSGGRDWHLGSSTTQVAMKPYFDTDNNGTFISYTGYGYVPASGYDFTNLSMGRIHAFKERPIPGTTLGRFSTLDFSYPSSLLDVAARTYFCTPLLTNQSMTPVADGDQAYSTSTSSSQSWRITAITLQRASGAEWPEEVESDPTQPAGTMLVGSHITDPPTFLGANTPVDFRSIGGDPALMTNPTAARSSWVGKPDTAAPFLFPIYWYDNPQAQQPVAAVPSTGGAPGLTVANGWLQGWCDMGDGGSWINAYNLPGWQAIFGASTLITPHRDPVASQYGYYPSAAPPGTTGYRYPVPYLTGVPVIVYDRDNDLLLLRFPQCFAQKLTDTTKGETANARVKDYRAKLGIDSALGANDGAGWIDRKLKVGDKFITSRGGYAFTVRALVDPGIAAATAPGTGAVNWSDGTYQIVRVTPSLKNTYFTYNKPVPRYGMNRWSDPRPARAIVAPCPAIGGASPWVSTLQLQDEGSATQAGVVFRAWNNLTD